MSRGFTGSRPVVFLSLFCLCIAPAVFGLDPAKAITQYVHDIWHIEQGLPQSTVNAIVQTSDGYLWLATQEGLVRFDGVRFTVFDKTNTPQLKHNWIWNLWEDSEQNLWIGTNGGGLNSYKDGKFTSYTSKHGLSNDFVRSIYADRKGNLWIGTIGGGLNRLKNGKFTSFTTKEGLSNDFVRAIYEDSEGSLWIGTESGLNRFKDGIFKTFTTQDGLSNNRIYSIYEDRQGVLWVGTYGGGLNRFKDGKFTNFTTKDGLSSNFVISIYEDQASSFWIGTEGGLNRFRDGKFSSFTTKEGLSNNTVYSIQEDREGSLWVGTFGGGLNRLKDGKFTSFTMKEGLSSNRVWSVYEDREGSLWIGTYGGGLNRLKDGKFTNFTTKDGLSSDFAISIYQDRQGSLWVGTRGGGLNRFKDGTLASFSTKDGLINDFVLCIYEDLRGVLWIGTEEGLSRFKNGNFSSFTSKEGLSNDPVRTIYEDRQGTLWIGTRGAGLKRLKDGKFTSFTTKDQLSSDTVYSIHEDAEGTLWIGTDGGGLNRFKDGKFTSYTIKDGMFDDVVFVILEDTKENLWMTSNKGIFRVAKSELNRFAEGKIHSIRSVAYGSADGMKRRECNGGGRPAGYLNRDGKLWFPTIAGIVMIDPEHIKTNDLSPPVAMEEVIVDNAVITNSVEAKEALRLPPGKEKFEFHYTALTFSGPEKVFFQYKLEGFDKNWVEAGRRRVAYYTNIPPGDYRFRVKACNSDGIWNEAGASFSFRLSPYFYQTPLFYGICVLSAILAGAGAYKARIRHLKKREHELALLVEERTAALKEQTAEMESLNQTVKIINKEMNLEKLLQSLLQQARILFAQAEIATFLILDHRTSLFKFAAASGYDLSETKDISLTQEEAVSRYTEGAQQLQEGVYIVRKFKDIAGSEKLKRFAMPKSMLAMAVTVKGKVEGFLLLENFQNAEAFGLLDLQKLNRFREHAVSAIVKARTLQQLEEADQIKSRFFANISHEFRTPLTLTLGPLENALSGIYGETGKELRKQHVIMLRNSQRLLRLINQLLDISKLEAGEMELRTKKQDLAKFARKTVSLFASLAEKKNIRLVFHCEEGLDLYFDTDKMEKIFYNLLSNAIKFTPKNGKVLISITEFNEGKSVQISVKDTGIGIPLENLPLIFDRFKQVGQRLQEHSGTGIGLSLVKDLVSLHGGVIEARSEPGFGSEFIIQLPQGKEHLSETQIVDDPVHEEFSANSGSIQLELETVDVLPAEVSGADVLPDNIARQDAILIVEDNRDVREYIRSCLPGYFAVEATNGEEGLQKVREFEPHLILSDVMMPKMDGYQFLQILKADPHLCNIPVILLTAKASEETKLEGLEAGADDYLAKPFNARELQARVKNLIQMRRQEQELKTFNQELERKVKEQLDALLKSRRLSKYVPSQIVEKILSSDQEELMMERKNLTILISDLSGFLELTDRLEAEKLKRLLNEYLSEMMKLMKEFGATPGSFLGDTLLSFFGAPVEMEAKQQAENAVSMGQAMQERLRELGRKWLAEGIDHDLMLRIGINQDYAMVGNIGSPELMEYTVIGRGVNLAGRLNAICVPGKILVSFPVYVQTREQFRYEELQDHPIPGFSGSVRIYELDTESPEPKEVAKRYKLKECPECGSCYDEFVEICTKDGTRLSVSLPVERTVDRKYRLERLIGKGGMGAVYEARDLRLDRKVAVKIMMGNFSADPVTLARFEREARLCAKLNHPNIIRIYDYGTIGSESAYLVMEYLDGSTLRAELNRIGRLAPSLCANWFNQICEGLRAAHQAGIVHRDLKPENILLSVEAPAVVIKILDFGLAKRKLPEASGPQTLTARGSFFGTLSYMSPEQLDGEEVDERSDIFTIGVMAAECLTGKHPFVADSSPLVMASILLKTFHLNVTSESHRQLDAVLQKCLAKDREERFQSVAEMQKQLIPALTQSDEPGSEP